MSYLPILQTRQSERLALRELADDLRPHINPLFMVHPPSLDNSPIPLDEHVTRLAAALARDWGPGPGYFDVSFLADPLRVDGEHPVTWIGRLFADRGLNLAPVTGISRDLEEQQAAIAFGQEAGRRPLLRLSTGEWARIGAPDWDSRIMAFVDSAGVGASGVDLLLDIGDQVPNPPQMAVLAVSAALAAIPYSQEWASITVAGSSMPITTSEIGRDNAVELPRNEWLLWKELRGSSARAISFGDYGTTHPQPLFGFDPRTMQIAAQIRYSVSQAWFIARGRGTRSAGIEQMHQIARTIASHPQFTGRDYSWGDQWIADCAVRATSPGNAGIWRKAALNHHLTLVPNQIANLGGS